ncbi:MAG: DUF4062 domain-containing protein, partial [Ktedonobacterales bacterium]|nr:DUF4062 domain-containing protein [Ktedonobacterales bacterium]
MAAASSSYHTHVFISSTMVDLPAHREAAMDAVWRCDMYPLAAERDSAGPHAPGAYSLQLADQAEVYVGIFAHRYGTIPPGGALSITEMEYRRARERKIPILIFMPADEHPIDPGDGEADPEKAAKLARLKAELRASYVVGFFRSPADLEYRVFAALVALRQQGVLPPAAQANTPHSRTVSTIPVPPTPYLAHPYILGRRFYGRQAELAALDAWAASSDPMLLIDAIGGAGKSALTWHWTQERSGSAIPQRASVVWWSFYESDATMDNFLSHTLAYLHQQPIEEIAKMPRAEAEQALLLALTQGQHLVVMDGLERVLQAYHRGDAAQLPDEYIGSANDATDATPDTTQRRTCV